jgi:kinesin family protein C1
MSIRSELNEDKEQALQQLKQQGDESVEAARVEEQETKRKELEKQAQQLQLEKDNAVASAREEEQEAKREAIRSQAAEDADAAAKAKEKAIEQVRTELQQSMESTLQSMRMAHISELDNARKEEREHGESQLQEAKQQAKDELQTQLEQLEHRKDSENEVAMKEYADRVHADLAQVNGWKLEELQSELESSHMAERQRIFDEYEHQLNETKRRFTEELHAKLKELEGSLSVKYEQEKEREAEELAEQLEEEKEEAVNAKENEWRSLYEQVKQQKEHFEAETGSDKQELADAKQRLQEAENRVQAVVAQLDSEKQEVERVRKSGREEADAEKQKAMETEEKFNQAQSRIESLEAELKAVRESAGATEEEQMSRLQEVTSEKQALERKIEPLEHDKETKESRIRDLEQQLLDAEDTRRKLHNTIQELKGNIRVFCRLRPPADAFDSIASTDDLDNTNVGMTVPPSVSSTGQLKEFSFNFDRVFDENASQDNVFSEVSQLVQSALDGYKVCLFSYGQTGSGKTHTMLGGDSSGPSRGIIPRSVEKVMEAASKLNGKGWSFMMEASYIEIYNENVRDLLKAGSVHSEKHYIVHDPSGCPTVSGAQRERIDSGDDAANLVRRASAARAVEATQINSHSSRSHTLFMLYITGTHESAGQQLQGCLVLVDLAGSERVERSGAEGARLTEACSINRSLSALNDVFQAIASKSPHVPYRHSKLTHLLQPCLGGDGKTLMFVNINPESSSASESLDALKFASKVNSVELGGPGAKRNVKSIEAAGGSSASGRRSSMQPGAGDKRKSHAPDSSQQRRNTFAPSKKQRRPGAVENGSGK